MEKTDKKVVGFASEQKRLSVRDLASKFDTRKAVAGAKPKVHDRDAQFHKLTSVLHELRGRVSGRSKVDVEEALDATQALFTISAHQEAELKQKRGEVKQLAGLFEQYSGHAKKNIQEAYEVAEREIATIKEMGAQIQNALEEHKQTSSEITGQDLEEFKRESHEARRIILLHESSRILDMEHQNNSLRKQLVEKAAEAKTLRNELEQLKLLQQQGGMLQGYRLTGREQLGTTLSIEPLDDTVCDLSQCNIQWHRIRSDDNPVDSISGAIRPQYAPEPFDVGRILRAEIIVPCGKSVSVQTAGPIDPAPGLDDYVEILVRKGGAQFNVRIVLKNGEIVRRQSLHTLDVNKSRIKLHNAHNAKAREIYSSSMQMCGARGGGDSAAQGLFWVAAKGVTFMLVLESERERNAAILLARKFAKLNNTFLGGPDDVAPLDS